MPCLVAIIALGAPRIALFLVWLFSDYVSRVYSNGLILLLGFIFMPLTTLAYAFAKNSPHGSVDGWYLVVMIVAVLMDLGVFSGAGVAHQRRLKA